MGEVGCGVMASTGNHERIQHYLETGYAQKGGQQSFAGNWKRSMAVRQPGGQDRGQGAHCQQAMVKLNRGCVLKCISPARNLPVLFWEQAATHEREGVVGMAGIQASNKRPCA